MGWFGFGKEKDVIDLGERYRKQQEKSSKVQDNPQETEKSSQIPFGFFSGSSNVKTSEKESGSLHSISGEAEERKKKLAKMLAEMTNRIEDLSNQVYHLQQRVELLERKIGVSGFG